jgi:hypothetical protein
MAHLDAVLHVKVVMPAVIIPTTSLLCAQAAVVDRSNKNKKALGNYLRLFYS